ncbi:LOW QUALITY PROTEIN: D-beta-hydroxybutyrate dehydrogenase, mitochondrial [Delphinus delphis]|uniref:LOW QUALITY PROTEIN: D-beta-hydroxybutyrate dehydrogenase, mitochondrial n=1 Tax=Delphinus delphis TaxID=9728 RepID=UPI0028C4DD11|nr:LOW QUALITY PROTEIN: D-beta-hydroxybutyrate dehydrogenase, mitochondrial [Delphinus delphis]
MPGARDKEDTASALKKLTWSPRASLVCEPTRRSLAILPLVATVLTARFSRPLSQLPRKTLNFSDRVNGARGSLLFHSASFVPVDRRTDAASVNPVASKAVLVTGCDSGFGFSLAKHLHSKGFLVFAGYLMKAPDTQAQWPWLTGLTTLQHVESSWTGARTCVPCIGRRTLNHCAIREAHHCPFIHSHCLVGFAAKARGASRGGEMKGVVRLELGLVNNAGISAFGDVEFTSMETYKEVVEVNLWGRVRGTTLSPPLLSCSAGCVVNTSGMLGRMAHAAGAPYCITRFGVAFSDCLRYEVHPLGVKVGVVEPGNFIATTSLHGAERIHAIASKMWDELPEGVRKDYGRKYFDERVAKMETYCNSSSTDTSPIISAVTHTLTSATPCARYHPMDYCCWVRMRITTHLPRVISDRIYIH